MTELKPCPFCGGEAHIAENVGYRGDIAYTVNCNAVYGCIASDSGLWYSSREAAVEAWNTRADYHGFEQAAIEAWKSIKTWNTRAERTCKVESKIFIEGEYVPCPYYEYEMECGGQFRWDEPEPPSFCPDCGAKVVDE